MTPSWYDVLGVDETASADEIRAAWQESVVGLEPSDRRFKQRNRAAEVLLDPARRAAHDAELAAQDAAADDDDDDADAAAPVDLDKTVGAPVPAPAEDDETTVPPTDTTPPAGRRGVLTGVLGVLALLLVVATVLSLALGGGAKATADDDLPTDREIEAARTAAAAAIVPLVSYDYRDLEGSKQAALAYTTDEFGQTYEQNFDAIVAGNAGRTKSVVTAEVADTPDGSPAVSVASTGAGRVDVLMFVNRPTTNKEGTTIYADQVTARMVDVDGSWLVDCLIVDGGGCPG